MADQQADAFDYVVVGAGTGGCVLASRLAEDPDVRVCMIEAGPMDRHPFIHIPATVGAAIATPALNWRFLTAPQAHLHNRRIPVPRGHVVGGSGSINGMVYFRGQPHGLRRVGGGRQRRLGLSRRAAVFPALGEQRVLRGLAVSCHRRADEREVRAEAEPDDAGVPRGDGVPRRKALRRLQRSGPGRLWPAAGHDPQRAARLDRDGVSASLPAAAAT